ncbi:MAG: hypothetical protein K4304_11815 [Propionicimonas sp.]
MPTAHGITRRIGTTLATACLVTLSFTAAAVPSASAASPSPTTTAPTAPTSAPPTTTAPTTQAPTTHRKTSAPPTSAAPSPTPTTASPTPTPTPAPADTGLPWWLWLVLAAALIGVAVYVIGRAVINRGWDRRFETVGGEIHWIHDQLIEQVLASPTAGSAAILWRDAAPRMASVEAELRALSGLNVSTGRIDRAHHLRRLLASVSLAVEGAISLPPQTDGEALRAAMARVRTAQAVLAEGLSTDGPEPRHRAG